jgi:peptidylprolyl isomerase
MATRNLIILLVLAAAVLGGGIWLMSLHGAGPGLAAQGQVPNFAPLGSTTEAASPASAQTATVSHTATSSTNKPQHVTQATLHTTMGDITIQLDNAAPNTVANFVKLAQSGYYDGVKFHRVIKGFMDQAGDPLTKDASQEARWGTGGPGYTIQDENMSEHNGIGVVSMANTGQPNSGGSQFFINAADNGFLDGKYAVFGKVTAGLDVVKAINDTQTDSSDRPLTPIVITSVTLQ